MVQTRIISGVAASTWCSCEGFLSVSVLVQLSVNVVLIVEVSVSLSVVHSVVSCCSLRAACCLIVDHSMLGWVVMSVARDFVWLRSILLRNASTKSISDAEVIMRICPIQNGEVAAGKCTLYVFAGLGRVGGCRVQESRYCKERCRSIREVRRRALVSSPGNMSRECVPHLCSGGFPLSLTLHVFHG